MVLRFGWLGRPAWSTVPGTAILAVGLVVFVAENRRALAAPRAAALLAAPGFWWVGVDSAQLPADQLTVGRAVLWAVAALLPVAALAATWWWGRGRERGATGE